MKQPLSYQNQVTFLLVSYHALSIDIKTHVRLYSLQGWLIATLFNSLANEV